jgi:hypothetical protein
VSGLGTFWFVVGVIVAFSVGVAYTVTRRAWADYREKKQSLPGMRREIRAGAWAATKAGALTALILFALLTAWLKGDR